MRLSFAVAAIAGLALGGATVARADAPPAAPIFYCPTPGKADPAPAATPARAPAGKAHVTRASVHRRHGCPVVRVAAEHRRGHVHGAAPIAVVQQSAPPPAPGDVSAAQAFIYRYERALHGLDARAADQAWAEGRHPPCPPGCPGPDGWRRDGAPPPHVYAQGGPVPPVEEPPPPVERAPPPPVMRAPPPPVAAPPPPPRAYAWQDDHGGYRYDERAEESERAGGWRYSEVDGQGRYQHWGDHFAGEPAWDDRDEGPREGRYRGAPRYRCPPPVPASSCSAGPDAPVRHSDAAAAGRDAAGYLTWPGKTE